MSDRKLRVCNKCGHAHFPQTREEIQKSTDDFGQYITSQTPEIQAMFGYGEMSKTKLVWDAAAHFKVTTKCFGCGNIYTDFHDETPADNIPNGVTIQGILTDI